MALVQFSMFRFELISECGFLKCTPVDRIRVVFASVVFAKRYFLSQSWGYIFSPPTQCWWTKKCVTSDCTTLSHTGRCYPCDLIEGHYSCEFSARSIESLHYLLLTSVSRKQIALSSAWCTRQLKTCCAALRSLGFRKTQQHLGWYTVAR